MLAGSGEEESRDGVGEEAAIPRPLRLALDEHRGLLYVTATDHRVRTIAVPTWGEKRAARIFPLVRLWALVQRGRAQLTEGEATRYREAVRRLMRCPVDGVIHRVLRFAIAPSLEFN